MQDKTRIITLTQDDGTEIDCALLAIFTVGKKQFAGFCRVNDQGEPIDADLIVYAYTQTGEQETDYELSEIDRDDVYNMAIDAFEEIINMVTEDEV